MRLPHLAVAFLCLACLPAVRGDEPSALLGIGSYSGTRITVLEADDAPVAQALVALRLRYDDDDPPVDVRGSTDARGLVRLRPPGGAPERFDVRVEIGPGAVFAQRFTGAPPSELTLRVGRLVPIGGRVVDEAEQPLPESEVRVRVGFRFNAQPGERLEAYGVDAARLTTDADGRWSLVIPEAFQQNLRFAVVAPQRPAVFFAVESRNGQPAFPPPGLFDGRHVTVLDRGLDLAGIVTLPDGRPAGGVEVRLWEVAQEDMRQVLTTNDGRFVLRGAPRREPNIVSARLDGHVLAVAQVPVAEASNAILLRLATGPGLRGRVVGPNGQGVRAGVWVRTVGDGNAARGVSWGSQTDGEGRFRWAEGPPGDYFIAVDPRGPFRRTAALGDSTAGELQFVAERDRTLILKPVRADNGEAVGRIDVALGVPARPNGEPLYRVTAEGLTGLPPPAPRADGSIPVNWMGERVERREDGTFQVNVGVQGVTRLRITSPGMREVQMDLPGGGNAPVPVKLEPAG